MSLDNSNRHTISNPGFFSHARPIKLKKKPLGDDLLSQEVALQVPSALTGLTAGFGMGPGVPPPLKSPRDSFTNMD